MGSPPPPSLSPRVSGQPATTTGNGDLRVCAEGHGGDVSGWAGFAGLEAIEDISMLCVPDLVAARQQGHRRRGVRAVPLAMIVDCELAGDRVAVLDPPSGLHPQRIRERRMGVAGCDSRCRRSGSRRWIEAQAARRQ
ncbi:hypothetical protein [Micromonospora carbonacea]|uniref:Uncharacterized protein n=1 Tax=Micromonospora carbonacea TaxID=47853 RepID=A0A1C5ADA9_9ACTN|nr:hypothetical protein [Micromonospora carbonacea]SCF43227.1 hypothetical protein GA0070563_112207 [Micromonospora carbonacea]